MKTKKHTALNKNQQAIVDAVASGAKLVRVIGCRSSARGRAISMCRTEHIELRRRGAAPKKMRTDTVDRLVARGLVTVEQEGSADPLRELMEALAGKPRTTKRDSDDQERGNR